MKPRSAKNKGKRLQNKVRDLILEKFDISLKEAKILIMDARLEMGWVSKEDYEKEFSSEEVSS